jgi:pimeloyl-ACP methyl ester carboxylesterase
MHALVSGNLEADPAILFVHANGFNARTYFPLLRALAKTHDVMALDMRGHGLTDLPTQARSANWYAFREDLLEVLSRFSTPPVLIGHSMGGTTSLLAAAKRPDLIDRVIAFDPPILPRLLQWAMRLGLVPMQYRMKYPLVRGAMSRRRTFDSHKAAFERYAGRRPFINWQDEFLQNYLADGLRQHGEHVVLSCQPEWEAHNYTAHGHDIWGALRRLKTPTLLIGGDGPGVVLRNRTLSRLGTLNTQIQTRHVDGSSHFLPMENPDLAQSLILDFLKGQA